MSEVIRVQRREDVSALVVSQLIVPQRILPKLPGVTTRLATHEDFGWIDALQKAESANLGFLPEVAFRKRIDEGNLLVATIGERQLPGGYCLGVDKYMKQGHVGVIFQLNVAPAYRRSLVAATLLQAQFDKSAYSTRLYGCWCLQSIAANKFWEAMGFVPLAFRAGGRKKRKGQADRVHIYWQKRIRPRKEDGTPDDTPYWYPEATEGGLMMESRVALPLPPAPEVHWSDPLPVLLPGDAERSAELKLLEGAVEAAELAERAAKRKGRGGNRGGAESAEPKREPVKPSRVVSAGGFGTPAPPEAGRTAQAQVDAKSAAIREAKLAKAAAVAKLKEAQKRNDPQLLAYARELRDKWQEHVAPGSEGARRLEQRQRGKYDVVRALEAPSPASSLGEGSERCGGMKQVENVKRLAA